MGLDLCLRAPKWTGGPSRVFVCLPPRKMLHRLDKLKVKIVYANLATFNKANF